MVFAIAFARSLCGSSSTAPGSDQRPPPSRLRHHHFSPGTKRPAGQDRWQVAFTHALISAHHHCSLSSAALPPCGVICTQTLTPKHAGATLPDRTLSPWPPSRLSWPSKDPKGERRLVHRAQANLQPTQTNLLHDSLAITQPQPFCTAGGIADAAEHGLVGFLCCRTGRAVRAAADLSFIFCLFRIRSCQVIDTVHLYRVTLLYELATVK